MDFAYDRDLSWGRQINGLPTNGDEVKAYILREEL